MVHSCGGSLILVQWSPLGSRRLSSYDMGSLRAARVAASYSKPCRACRWDCLRRAALMGKVDDGSSSGLECAFAATHLRTYIGDIYIYIYVNIYIYAYIYVYVYICINLFFDMYIYIFIQIYINICMHSAGQILHAWRASRPPTFSITGWLFKCSRVAV